MEVSRRRIQRENSLMETEDKKKERSRRRLHALYIHTIRSDGTDLVHEPMFKDFTLSAVTLDQPKTLHPEIVQGVSSLAEMPSHRISQILLCDVPNVLSNPFFQRAQGLPHI